MLGLIGLVIEIFKINLKNKYILSFCIIIVVLFSSSVFLRSFDFRSDMILENHDINVLPPSYSIYSALSGSYNSIGQYDKGIIYAQKSINIFPYLTNFNNLGTAYGNLGEYKKAQDAYTEALRYGDYYLTYENLASIDLVYGSRQKNISFIKNIALKKYPSDGKLWQCAAGLDYVSGNIDTAKVEIQHAYELDPTTQIAAAYYIIMNNKPLKLNI